MNSEIPLQSLVKERLSLLIEAASAEDLPFGYGFLLHPRRDGEDFGFGAITSGGESFFLTPALLDSLREQLCWAFGAVPMNLEATAGSGPPTSTDQPVRKLGVRISRGILKDPELRAFCPPNGEIAARTLSESLVLLTRDRPAGWPI